MNAHAAAGCLEVAQQRFSKEIGRIDQHRKEARGGNQFMYELKALGTQLRIQRRHPGEVATRPISC